MVEVFVFFSLKCSANIAEAQQKFKLNYFNVELEYTIVYTKQLDCSKDYILKSKYYFCEA